MRRNLISLGLLAAALAGAALAGEEAAPAAPAAEPAAPAAEPVAIGPTKGTVSRGRVNLRIKPGQGSDCFIVAVASKGDEVTVWRRQGKWYEVSPPGTAPTWIFGQFVKMPEGADPTAGRVAATVKGDRVRVRSRGDQHGHVLTELADGTALTVIDERNGWYRVEPPAAVRVWIFAEYVDLAGAGGAVTTPTTPTTTTTTTEPRPAAERAKREKEAEGHLAKIKTLVAEARVLMDGGKTAEAREKLRGARELKGLLTVDYADTAAAGEAAGVEIPSEEELRTVEAGRAASAAFAEAEKLHARWLADEVGSKAVVDLVKLYLDVMHATPETEEVHRRARSRLAEVRLRLQGIEAGNLEERKRLEDQIAQLVTESKARLAREGDFTGIGRVERVPELPGRPGTHRLRKGGVVLYYLKSEAVDLDQCVGLRVGVQGDVTAGPSRWGGQVIHVTRVVVLK